MRGKELSDNWLLLYCLITILVFIYLMCISGCTPEAVPQETERLRSHQVKYKAALTGSQVVYYRAADGGTFKVIGSRPSGLNTVDTVWTETKTTIEKY